VKTIMDELDETRESEERCMRARAGESNEEYFMRKNKVRQ